MLRNGRRALPRALTGQMRGRLRRALGELAVTIERTATVGGPGPVPAGRADARRRDPAGQPARPRCAADPQGPHRQAGRGSGTRPRSPATTTASSWITRPGRQPARRSSACAGGQPDRPARRAHAPFGHRRPRVRRARDRAGPAGPRDTPRRHPAQSQALSRPPRRRARPRLPDPRQMANRLRRPDQLSHARIRLGPHPARWPRRSFHLVRARGIQPQPGQDQRSCQLTRPARTRECRQYRGLRSAFGLFQGEVNYMVRCPRPGAGSQTILCQAHATSPSPLSRPATATLSLLISGQRIILCQPMREVGIAACGRMATSRCPAPESA